MTWIIKASIILLFVAYLGFAAAMAYYLRGCVLELKALKIPPEILYGRSEKDTQDKGESANE